MSFETTSKPGTDGAYIPIAPAMKGTRFVGSLHIPAQALWHMCLAGYAYLSQQNVEQQILLPSAFDGVKE